MNVDFRFYLKLLLRRFPILALLFLVCASLGVMFAMRMPEIYTTSARLLVEDPQIPDSMVTSIVRTDAIEQLDIIEQRLLTRANLIDLANRFEVFEDMRTIDPDIVVQRMRQATSIRRSAGRNQATLMTIRFTARNGQIAANVVNEYVTLVLEANADFRIGRAESTLEFFEQEVARLGAELDAQSIRIATFKSENSNALPEDQSYRLGRQTLLQERLSLLERDLRQTVAQKDDFERLFEATGRVGQGQQIVQNRPSAEEQQLVVARTDLELALTTYSEENPRVVRLQSVVDRLEAVVAAQKEAQAIALTEATGGEPATSPEMVIFQATMLELDARIEELTGEIERIEAELESIQAMISASSANGIQLSALERDYEILQGRYNGAVQNLNEARISERIEVTAQGQRITVIENANVPRLPSGPSPFRVVALACAAGIALAGGFFFLLEILNRTIRRPAELQSKFDIVPIATIPYMESRGRRMARRLSLVTGSLVVLIGVPAALWYIDTNYMPLDLVVQKVLERLGLV